MAKAINIVLDEKDPTQVIFVEIEKDSGESTSIGQWFREEGSAFAVLRITPEDIQNA